MTIKFDWNDDKNSENFDKHGIDFETALLAFEDPDRIIAHDEQHSAKEQRWFCIGKVEGRVLLVRFTVRDKVIRIIGAGYWRKWRKFYEEQKKEKHSKI